MDRWQIFWVSALAVGVILFVVGFGFALAYRGESEWANFASIWGIWVRIIGFILTLYALADTRRVSREAEVTIKKAAAEAAQAVRQAQEQTRQVLEKTAMVLLVSELENLRRLLVAVRESGEAAQWQRASFQCQEATLLIIHLSGNPHLVAAEVTDLLNAAGALDRALRYINGRLARNQLDPGLPSPHATNIGATIQSVSVILSRLRKLSMEVPHAT